MVGDMMPGIVTMAVAPRFRAVAGSDDRSGESDQPENANSQRARGSQGCTKHLLPRPNFCLDHRFVRRNCAHRPGDISLFKALGRVTVAARLADQVDILAKILFPNSFQAACGSRTSPGIRLGGASFQKVK